jgi:hypothetical protein
MKRAPMWRTLALAALFAAIAAGSGHADAPTPRPPSALDSLDTESRIWFPAPNDSGAPARSRRAQGGTESEGGWLRASYGEGLITDIEPWRIADGRHQDLALITDYNRVDPLRLGLGWHLHGTEPWMPRVGARVERAFGRDRTLYGVQMEQPVVRNGRISLGVIMLRKTDHNDLQQSGDAENSLSLLLARADERDYFEREGAGAYVSWRVPDFSAISVQAQTDEYRSLPARYEVRSWMHQRRTVRANPAIDEGNARTLILRLDHPAQHTRRQRAGLFHWIEIERAGHGMGGDFAYTRGLADVRSVVRLTPATTLAVRAVAGQSFDGKLPAQKLFTLGGPDGLGAHPVDAFRGNRIALAQAEYDVGLWQLPAPAFEGGLMALAFFDVGHAWSEPGSGFGLGRQKPEFDAGFGVGTSDNALRVYFAKDVRDLNRDFDIHVRLQRPF